MINPIIEAIGAALGSNFGEQYTIYSEAIEQDFNEPCFFISCMSRSQKLSTGNRYWCENVFCIQYFPFNSLREREESQHAAEKLFSCLEILDVDGNLLRGTKMNYEISDGVLSFFVSYNFFICKEKKAYPMENLSENIYMKG